MPAIDPKRGLDISSLTMPEESFELVHIPELSKEIPAEIPDFGPYHYPYLLIMPEFRHSLFKVNETVTKMASMIEPFNIKLAGRELESIDEIYSEPFEYKMLEVSQNLALRAIHMRLFGNLRNAGACFDNFENLGGRYYPVVLAKKDAEPPEAFYFDSISLVQQIGKGVRRLVGNYDLEG